MGTVLSAQKWRDIAILWQEVWEASSVELEQGWQRATEGLVSLVDGSGLAGVVQRKFTPPSELEGGFDPVYFSTTGVDMDHRLHVIAGWMADDPGAQNDAELLDGEDDALDCRVMRYNSGEDPKSWDRSAKRRLLDMLDAEDSMTIIVPLGLEVECFLCIDRLRGDGSFDESEGQAALAAIEGLRPLVARYVRSHGLMPGQRRLDVFERSLVKLLLGERSEPEIAELLDISLGRLESDAAQIYTKLGVANRIGLVHMWVRGENAQVAFSADVGPDVDVSGPDIEPGATSLEARVHHVLANATSSDEFQLGSVARHLGLSKRSLQRQLRASNTSFRKLTDDFRREHAKALLARPKISITDIALRLGYGQVSSFNRAVKRWAGMTPSDLRQALLADS